MDDKKNKNEIENKFDESLAKTQETWQDMLKSVPRVSQEELGARRAAKKQQAAELEEQENQETEKEQEETPDKGHPLLDQLKRLRFPKLEIPDKDTDQDESSEEEPNEIQDRPVEESRDNRKNESGDGEGHQGEKRSLTEEERQARILRRKEKRRRERRRKAYMVRAAVIAALVLILIAAVAGIVGIVKLVRGGQEETQVQAEQVATEQQIAEEELQATIAQADRLAAGYDYDSAISLLQEAKTDGVNTESIDSKISEYETTKSQLQPADLETIPHVFFHILVADPSITWNLTGDDEYKIADYNQVMTTVDEFKEILQQMYDRGYVLVRIHDMVEETTDEEGNTVFTEGQIMLPEGKKPFVMSQDDVCYYFYMIGDGYASKMVVGEDGRPTTEYIQEDGTIVTGAYDLVPILDEFIDEHPDFSYKGAKAILAFTGYNGVLGYRTDPDLSLSADEGNSYADEYGVFDYEDEIEQAKPVVQALKDDGYELASHSYGHISYGSSFEKVKEDADKWQERVANVIGETDIILYPFGTDIGSWTGYEDDNETYQYLRDQGFRFFCNVDSNQYWNQIRSDYVRQGRRNLDGYRMYQDLYNGADKLSDLIDVSTVFDQNRPTTGLEEWDGAE